MGKMGSSIFYGIVKKGLYKKDDILFFAPSSSTQEKYRSEGVGLANDQRDLVERSSIIILAIKPQKYDEVFACLDGLDLRGKIFVSLAPGKDIASLSATLAGATVCRAMPNTPATIGKAMTTLAFASTPIKEVEDIFSSIGATLLIDEGKMDEVIPLQGGLPAYLFYFAKAFLMSAKEQGINEDVAKKLLFESIIGSSQLALQSEESLDTLIDQVCSKGGSTIAGLNKLKDGSFEEDIKACFDACVSRSKELAKV